VFVYFLWKRIRRAETSAFAAGGPDQEGSAMLDDILDTLDDGKELDAVMTSKVVVKSIIEIVSLYDVTPESPVSGCGGLLCLLAHIFAKFPDMWTMSWMFVRHRLTGRRAHRLAWLIPAAAKRPPEYFESKAFMSDFIYKYWNYKKYY